MPGTAGAPGTGSGCGTVGVTGSDGRDAGGEGPLDAAVTLLRDPSGSPTGRRRPRADASGRGLLLELQRRALRYFLDNQGPGGLILDRQANRGPSRSGGTCSTSATGMGLIALALASAPPYRLLAPGEAAVRIGAALRAALERLPQDHGVLPHFIDPRTGRA